MIDSSTSSLSPSRRSANDDNMIPLINIVFLLLIFFMVSSRIDAFRPTGVVLPQMDATEKASAQSLSIVLNASGDILVDEQNVDLQQLGARIEALDLTLSDPKITLQADKHITAAVLSPVLTVLQEHQLSDITLYVQRQVPEST